MLPAFKGDMQLHETYSFANNSLPLSTPIVAYGGGSDQSVTADDLRQWQQMSSAPLELMVVEGGGHFYTESHTEEFLAHVKQQLEAVEMTMSEMLTRVLSQWKSMLPTQIWWMNIIEKPFYPSF